MDYLALQERIEHLAHKEQMYLSSINGVREDLCNPLILGIQNESTIYE